MGDSNLHALLSPSGAKRWMTCTPSARLEQQFPDSSGDAAREGTLAHSIGEVMLKYSIGLLTKVEASGQLLTLVQEDLENGRQRFMLENEDGVWEENIKGEFYNQSMHDYCEQYATFVMEQLSESRSHTPNAELFVEQRLNISDYAPESFGTGDAAIVANTVLKVIDLKYGKGVEVSAIDNPQLKVYALGWLREFDQLYNITEVQMTIFQPRIDNYSTWSISVTDLLAWAEKELKPKAIMAFAGEGEFVAGDHCQFCRAKTSCKALHDYCMELAVYEFADPPLLSDEQISDVLLRKAVFVNWIEAVHEHAFTQATKFGKKWPGFKLVEGRSNRRFTDEKKVIKELTRFNFTEEQYYKKSLLGIGDMQDLVGGAKTFNRMFAHLITKPIGSPVLVPLDDKRDPINSAAKAVTEFSDEEEIDPEA